MQETARSNPPPAMGGIREDVIHRMGRRCREWDYSARAIYLVTVCLKERGRPVLAEWPEFCASPETAKNNLAVSGEARENLAVSGEAQYYCRPTPLGEKVLECWRRIPEFWPQVNLLQCQLMPDHFHGLLFVESPLAVSGEARNARRKTLGDIVRGFKTGCREVEWEDVKFAYSPDRPLIDHFSLSVKPGQRAAIVGPTGCGKTTLINLLMRFYEVQGGEIRVDGTDIRQIRRDSLRGAYGMVLQDTWLKPGTIRENIAMGRPDAPEDEIVAAAKAAHAHSFIMRLPEGYDTVIGEDGGMLSQGQKQLLCIARVMLCLPPMLILDEATSSIDTRTEMRIQSAFARMMKGRTSFIVAHRLSTIREADVIIVMRDGHIVEQGDHNSLIAKKGFYYELYNSQFAAGQAG